MTRGKPCPFSLIKFGCKKSDGKSALWGGAIRSSYPSNQIMEFLLLNAGLCLLSTQSNSEDHRSQSSLPTMTVMFLKLLEILVLGSLSWPWKMLWILASHSSCYVSLLPLETPPEGAGHGRWHFQESGQGRNPRKSQTQFLTLPEAALCPPLAHLPNSVLLGATFQRAFFWMAGAYVTYRKSVLFL